MRTVIIAGIAGVLASGSITIASPAHAGCQSAFVGIFGGGKRCDGPIDQLGNYTRCDSGHGMGFGGSNCYVVNISDSGQPPRLP